MNLEKYIEEEVEKGNSAFSPMLFLGYPDIGTSKKAIDIIKKYGYTFFHTGIPISKGGMPPNAGKVYERTCNIASQNVAAEEVLEYFSSVRPNMYTVFAATGIVTKHGLEDLLERMKGRVDAVIPMSEKSPKELQELSHSYGIDIPMFVTPLMSRKDVELNVRHAEGFVYLRGAPNSRYGVSMYPLGLIQAAARGIKKMRDIHVCVGVGMKTPEDVRAVASLEEIDGVVLASEMIARLSWGLTEFENYLKSVVNATKNIKAK